jgi:hypothetical protein
VTFGSKTGEGAVLRQPSSDKRTRVKTEVLHELWREENGCLKGGGALATTEPFKWCGVEGKGAVSTHEVEESGASKRRGRPKQGSGGR